MYTLAAQSNPLSLTPSQLKKTFPITPSVEKNILQTRQEIARILSGLSQKTIVIVGPCSIHDRKAAYEYAHLLKKIASEVSDHLLILMRVYFEKPRTGFGWKGLINDPQLEGKDNPEEGIVLAREILSYISQLGLPIATEFLNSFTPVFLADFISWSAIGARTTTSPLHREIASALPMPVGFKNTLDGNVSVAIEASKVASTSHSFFTIDEQGHPIIAKSLGNPDCHIILRGSTIKGNYQSSDIKKANELLKSAQLLKRFIVDCSHGNSGKAFQNQKEVLLSVMDQIHNGTKEIAGVMIESHLLAGKQDLIDKQKLIYGQSITDACLSWEETAPLLYKLADLRQSLVNL